jgi:hypothetical protein
VPEVHRIEAIGFVNAEIFVVLFSEFLVHPEAAFQL